MSRLKVRIIVLLLLFIFAFLAISSIAPDRKSATCDELAHHIPVGYVLLSKGDLKMDTSQPPLPRYIVALPLKLFLKVNMPVDRAEWRREDRGQFGKDFFYRYNNQPKKMLFAARLAVIIIGLFCGLILFRWARLLYGDGVALFSLFLYVFSPNILAHTALATTDMVATCFILFSAFIFWKFLGRPSPANTIFAGVCLGLAQLSKYTAILLYPAFLLLLLFELAPITGKERRSLVLKFLSIVFISIITTWAGYGFDFEPILYNVMRQQEKIMMAHSFTSKVFPSLAPQRIDNFLLNFPIPLGAHLLGILGVLRHGSLGHSIYFLGKWSKYGNPLYFVVAFLIKTPIPTLILLFFGIFISLKQGIKRNERFIFLLILLFFASASFSKLQLGLRYILPIYPFCFILAARGIEFIRKKSFRFILIPIILWYVFSAVKTWPDYLSYFNEFIGGPKNGYKYLRDSNVDWGQDLPALAKYMKDNNINEVKLFYFGTADPADYGIKYKGLEGEDYLYPGKGIYAISVHFLEKVKWAHNYRPVANIGYSMFIYNFLGMK